jgi:hypothetical protein
LNDEFFRKWTAVAAALFNTFHAASVRTGCGVFCVHVAGSTDCLTATDNLLNFQATVLVGCLSQKDRLFQTGKLVLRWEEAKLQGQDLPGELEQSVRCLFSQSAAQWLQA